MSYTKQLLYSIADQMGRNRKDMDPYVHVLEKNWYDTRESLQSLTPQDFDRFEIPKRLSAVIMEKLGTSSQQQSSSHQHQSHHSSAMDEEFSVSRAIGNIKKKLSQ